MIQFESSEAGNTAREMEEWKTAGIPTMKPGLYSLVFILLTAAVPMKPNPRQLSLSGR